MPIELTETPSAGSALDRIKRWKPYIIGATAALVLLGMTSYAVSAQHAVTGPHRGSDAPSMQCAQAARIYPDFEAAGVRNSSVLTSEKYRRESVERLAGAVRVPTVSYDDMSFNVTDEPRFDVFAELHAYLHSTFPHAAKHAETVNTYGLLYTIPGRDTDAKPVLLMAHQDVVPVPEETLDQWEYPPFAAHFDAEFLHGRGVADTKNSLIAILEAVEELLAQGWAPERPLLLAFGFDEEISGFRGARELAREIEARYGPESIEMLIDEGGGLAKQYGAYFAMPSVAEKGRVNFRVTLDTPGGHSSMPPDHTGIGIVSDLVTQLEGEPLPARLPTDTDAVIRSSFACVGRHAPDVPQPLKSVFEGLGSPFFDEQLVDYMAQDLQLRTLVETTQAIDIIHGGVKINALPEQVVFETNYRIRPGSSIAEVRDRFLRHASTVATTYGLSLNYSNPFAGSGEQSVVVKPGKEYHGAMLVELTDSLEVAPISPYYNSTDTDSTYWDLIGATTKHVLQDVADDFEDLPVHSAPMLLVGNTDTAHYWNLTSNIYRYTASLLEDMQEFHTVGERLRFRSHISAVIFYYEFLINIDAS